MQKILISLPDQLAVRMRATLPSRQRSKIITHLIEEEIKKREHSLYECARAVEQDTNLREEMVEWDVTISDGLRETVKSISASQKLKKSRTKIIGKK